MSGAITGDGERTEEEKEGDPPHPRFPPTFSRCCSRVVVPSVQHVSRYNYTKQGPDLPNILPQSYDYLKTYD